MVEKVQWLFVGRCWPQIAAATASHHISRRTGLDRGQEASLLIEEAEHPLQH